MVVVRNRDDVLRTIGIARRHGVSITARGGGTSQAGQAIGEGLQLDTSRFFNRVLEVNPEERWARIEPGIVLDELNAHLAPHRLRFAPDISTANRATVGGMISNNSSGARSVLYGKTIDHVLDLHVALGDGSVAHLRPLAPDELEAACAADTLEGACYRTVRELAPAHAAEIDRRYPKILRRVGGYNLDRFTDPGRPFNLAELIVGSEGTLGLVVEARVNLVPLPDAKAVLALEFDDLLDALGATPAILEHRPSAIEVMDRSSSTTPARAPPSTHCAGPCCRATRRRAPCSASSSTPTTRPSCRAASRPSRRTSPGGASRAARRGPSTPPPRPASGACGSRRWGCRWR